jgi:hypothetical protein
VKKYNPKTSDISHVSETLGDEKERFERLIKIGGTLFKPTVSFGKTCIEEYTVINARNALNNKSLIVLQGDRENIQIVHWKSIQFNYSMECYFSRKEDAIYILNEHLKKIVTDSEQLMVDFAAA